MPGAELTREPADSLDVFALGGSPRCGRPMGMGYRKRKEVVQRTACMANEGDFRFSARAVDAEHNGLVRAVYLKELEVVKSTEMSVRKRL